MIYQIKLNDESIIYDVRDDNFFVENPELKLEINKVGELSFTIYDDHPYFDRLVKLNSILTVYKDNRIIFKGRYIDDQQGIDNSKKIVCESYLAFLNDSVYRPFSFSGTPEEFFTAILANHNSQVSDNQKILKGNVTVTDPNDYIARSSVDYSSSWNILDTKLLQLNGGYLRERYEDDGVYLDYLEDFTDTSTQIVEFGENLMDITAKNDASATYSVVIPLGAEITDANGNKSRLTISSVNNGKDYLVNEDALARYGWIVAPVLETTWDDVTLASNLKTKGTSYLNNVAVMLASTLDLTALDLNATDSDIESFFIYEYIRVLSTPHNVNERYLVRAITIPLAHPENTKISVGKAIDTLTGIELGNKQNIDDVIVRVGTVEKNYELNEVKISELENSIEYFSADLSQYNLTIPTSTDKKPLETKNYDVNFYGYFKGKQVTPTVSISGTNTGITVSKTSTYIRFAVNASTAIPNVLNEYQLTFTYTADGTTYSTTKIIDIALAMQGQTGADGTSVTILGSYDTYEELITAHPTGNAGDSYLINGDLYVWCVDTSEWQDVGSIQGPKGDKGDTGETGQKGADGITYYTWIKYADTPTSGMSDSPTNKIYMGIAYNKTTTTESTNYSDYAWSLIKGADGEDGQDGQNGANGIDGVSVTSIVNYYAVGTSNTEAPTTNWGTSIPARTSGQYLWVKELITFSNGNTEFTTAFVVTGDKGDKGDKGEQGIQGATGANGISYYFYVRYSANSNGNPMTTTPQSNTKYMGVASTTSTTAPTSYSAYTWTLIKGDKGDKGDQGSQGQTGADGKSSYLHIKYSNDGTTFTGNGGEEVGRYRGELVDNNPTDSSTFSDYTWYDMALIVDEELNEIRQEVVNNTSLIEQTDTKIRLDVASEYVSTGAFDEFREETNTQFTVQADGVEAKFSEIVLMVENVEGETQAQFREFASYIRGYQNELGQPVLELGSVTSDIILRQTNDRIQFIQNGAEVAYVSNNTLYITDGHFLNSLRIGNFAFIPRANGSLDFKKVTI